MKKSYMAFATMTDGAKEWRVNIGKYETEAEAEEIANKFAEKYKEGTPLAKYTGTHRFYTFTAEEWRKQQYTGKSIHDPKIRTWMTNEGNGCVLLFEHVHFEII